VVPFAPKVYTRPTGKAYISFQTLCSPMFNEYRVLFYSNGVKIVPPTIGELLTARGLAYFLGNCPLSACLDFGVRRVCFIRVFFRVFIYVFVCVL
jgi:hypothetical protein